MAIDGYHPIPLTNGLFKHNKRKTIFALCVDDFGVKYHSQQDLQHLITSLRKYYDISIDYDGQKYCGLQLDWHYNKEYVDISMPSYIKKALKKYNHSSPLRPQYSPHCWNNPTYEKSLQIATEEPKAPLLEKEEKQRTQSIIGTYLFYEREVDPTVLTALNDMVPYFRCGWNVMIIKND